MCFPLHGFLSIATLALACTCATSPVPDKPTLRRLAERRLRQCLVDACHHQPFVVQCYEASERACLAAHLERDCATDDLFFTSAPWLHGGSYDAPH